MATTRPGARLARPSLARPRRRHLAALLLQAVSKLLNSTKGDLVFFLFATLSTLGTAIIVLALLATILSPALILIPALIITAAAEPAEPYPDYCARLILGKVLRTR